MFIGHFAVGFAAKRFAPKVSLGTLFLGCQLADLVWPTLVLLGAERFRIEPGATAVTPLDFVSYPYSHSLLALVLWGALLAAGYAAVRRGTWRTSLVLIAVVVSHWVLDAVSHRPDMPLTIAGSTRVGLGLWNSIPATLVVEGLLFVIGLALYTRSTQDRDRTGRVALWAFVGFLISIYCANVFGPPPPNEGAVAWAAQALWLLVAWGYWMDHHRKPLLSLDR